MRSEMANLSQPISASNSAASRRLTLTGTRFDYMAASAIAALVLAAVVGITNRRGVQLLVIGLLLNMLRS